MLRPPPSSTLFPYTTLFRSSRAERGPPGFRTAFRLAPSRRQFPCASRTRSLRSEEHTSELQSHHDLVCRLLLEKKKHDGAAKRGRGKSRDIHIAVAIGDDGF